jgi:3-dehydroquinate synthetase
MTTVGWLQIGLPPADYPCQFDMIVQDKKVERGKLTFILARAIGRPSSK